MIQLKTKDIIYKIIIPNDNSISGEEILNNNEIKTKNFGYCGEILTIWLVASWDKDASYLGKVDWSSNIFSCELTNNKEEKINGHISTQMVNIPNNEFKSIVKELCAAVPLQVQLLHYPIISSTLTIWKDDFSTKITSTNISINLPINFKVDFKIEYDSIIISLDFNNSLCNVNNFELHFTPQSNININEFEKAFALRNISNSNSYILSMASSDSIKYLGNLKLSLSIFWENNKMLSHFLIELPHFESQIGLLWIIPKLEKLKQSNLSIEITNISNNILNINLELIDRPLIPLIKNLFIEKLEINERRIIDIPCVPCISGIFELNYKLKINNQWFKPLFKTIVNIK